MLLARFDDYLDRHKPKIHHRDRDLSDWDAETCPCEVAAGNCRLHPQARPAQRPLEKKRRTWLVFADRGWAKTRCGSEWVRNLVETGQARRVALGAPTDDDVRDVMIKGKSGLLAISPPDFRPR
jgi:phage terminase large subunit-like protein